MKKRKVQFIRLGIVLVLIFYFSTANAQWSVGVEGGYTNNNLSTTSGFAGMRHYGSHGGFTVGVTGQYAFFDWLALQADVLYIQKNYSVVRDEYDYTMQVNSNYTNGFMQLPIYGHFSIGGDKLRAFLNAGLYVGYWLNSHIKGKETAIYIDPNLAESDAFYSFDEKVPFDSKRDNRFDGGAVLGIGFGYKILPKLQVLLEGRYYRAFSDLQKDYMRQQIHRYNNTFTVQVGCMLTIGK